MLGLLEGEGGHAQLFSHDFRLGLKYEQEEGLMDVR
jgi:hypothetical protein